MWKRRSLVRHLARAPNSELAAPLAISWKCVKQCSRFLLISSSESICEYERSQNFKTDVVVATFLGELARRL